uniref:RING-type domain-containing protein n=1 Tax=Syphacia muris TaxID=451379 RepID=A0A158R548_9BILA
MGTTFVETVNINFEDFSESFLTCATCLSTYDQFKRKAKLLPCSHTICLQCLLHMEELAQKTETNVLRCPMCRELAILPPGGVTALPSSFLINQLYDLMQKQRKEAIANCSLHSDQQLMYCETCDRVYCISCVPSLGYSCAEHNVLPFSVASKRISEIIVHKAKQCVGDLDQASKNVNFEMQQLEKNVGKIDSELSDLYEKILKMMEEWKKEFICNTEMLRDEKRKVFCEQLKLIDSCRKRLKAELETSHVDVQEMRSRTEKVAEIAEEITALMNPRENSFLKLQTEPKKFLSEFKELLTNFGTVSGSTTFPGLCTIQLAGPSSSNVRIDLLLKTFSADGKRRNSGGDPVTVKIKLKDNDLVKDEISTVMIHDQDDGTYKISFKVTASGHYLVWTEIFDRPIKTSPLLIPVSSHHSPFWQFGSAGSGELQLSQPTKICQDKKGTIYILDTGNNRIKVLDVNGHYIKDVYGKALNGSSTVGMAVFETGEIMTLNWRKKEVVKSDVHGNQLQTMTFSEFEEPVDICIDSCERILIADASTSKVFVFDTLFRPLFSFSTEVYSSDTRITCVSVGINDDIVVGTNSCLLVFDGGGKFLHEIRLTELSSKTSLMPITCSVCRNTQNVLTAVIDVKKNRAKIVVSQYKGQQVFSIDSYGSRLRHPCGICIPNVGWDESFFVVDSASCSVRAFRYH